MCPVNISKECRLCKNVCCVCAHTLIGLFWPKWIRETSEASYCSYSCPLAARSSAIMTVECVASANSTLCDRVGRLKVPEARPTSVALDANSHVRRVLCGPRRTYMCAGVRHAARIRRSEVLVCFHHAINAKHVAPSSIQTVADKNRLKYKC